MTLLRTAAALAIVGFLAACNGAPTGTAPVGAPVDPMTDSGLAPDPMNPGSIDDSSGTQM